jgi:hyperosmotically inducible protein
MPATLHGDVAGRGIADHARVGVDAGSGRGPFSCCLAGLEPRLAIDICYEDFAMRASLKLTTVAAVALFSTVGCRVINHEETTGQYVDDTTISARAKAALIKDNNVKSSDFSIEVYQGNVTLTGVARTPTEAKLAVEDIRAVDGVKSLKNDVRIADADTAVPK